MTLETGAALGGRYTLGDLIASGGMGDVWEATDEVLQRPVAVKVMRSQGPDDGAFLERFRDEARGSASLHHPNIASVFDYGEQDGTAYLVMELVPGRTLGDIIREHDGGMPSEQVRSVLGQAALALSAAHDAGVVHRDVKPANILVTPSGQAKLTDFGIARLGAGSGHTLTGEVLGTPDYISPEQALGEPATPASDIYSLGVIAHEMITGQKPFDMGTPVATAIAQVTDPPPELSPTVPLDLRQVIDACLAKSAADRPSDARAVARAAGAEGATALAGATPTVPGAASGPSAATRLVPERARRRPTPLARRWGWLVVPAVGVVAWSGFALGSAVNSPASGPAGAATATSGAARTSGASPTAAPTPADATSSTTSATTHPADRTTAPPTRASTTHTTTARSTVSSSTAKQPAHPRKGKGKGKAK